MPSSGRGVAAIRGSATAFAIKIFFARIQPFNVDIVEGALLLRQIERFDGSYILALAGYNAGPGRVRDWIEEFGDPRRPNVDPIDWVELIPIQETRNYVQRIIESLQVYRAKLAGGRSNLLILNDLKR